MKAIIDKSGMLWHEQGKREWPVKCPHFSGYSEKQADGSTIHFADQCGDWCALWQEIEPPQCEGCRSVRVDCRGNWHYYDAYDDQREGGKE